MGASLYLQLTRRESGLFPKVWGADPLPGADWELRQLLLTAEHGLDVEGVAAWAAHRNNSKDIPEQDKRERTGCFSVNQSVPPWDVLCPARRLLPPTSARSDHETQTSWEQ